MSASTTNPPSPPASVAAASAGLDVVALSAAATPAAPSATAPSATAKAAPGRASDAKPAAANPEVSASGAADAASVHLVAETAINATSHTSVDAAGHDGAAPEPAPPASDSGASAAKTDTSANALTTAAPQAPQTTAATAAATAQTAHAAPIPDQIAGQLAAKLTGTSSRFDISLDPAGLGHVNVSVQINAAGQVTAALTFDNPHAAAEARSGAAVLQHALEQAGFNVAQGGLSFDVGGQGANLSRQDARPQTPANAFATTADVPVDTLATLSAAYGASRASSGVDITI